MARLYCILHCNMVTLTSRVCSSSTVPTLPSRGQLVSCQTPMHLHSPSSWPTKMRPWSLSPDKYFTLKLPIGANN
ncbi:hypothetical protein B0H14DRAFT_2811857 [Mycena olivaceomarginata]|nr:hypothetical protein B0H14DRAFT_2811857 [Mycena olivaceomarginata]